MKTLKQHRQTVDTFIVDALQHGLPGKCAPFLAVRPLRRPPAVNTEFDEQVEVVNYLRRAGHLVYAVPNEGTRSPAERSRKKREGLLQGAPDLLWEHPQATVALEMKRASGTLSDIDSDQSRLLSRRAHLGKPCVVCFGYKAARYYAENFEAFWEFQKSLHPQEGTPSTS